MASAPGWACPRLLGAAALLALAATLGAPETAAAGAPVGAPKAARAENAALPPAGNSPKLESFRVITARNIFDPNRVDASARAGNRDLPRATGDFIALVGTMQFEKGLYAFFDSTSPKYRQVLKAGGRIGDFTVKKVTHQGVELARDDKTYPLRVAQQLRRPEGGDWTVSAAERIEEAVATSAAGEAAPLAIPAGASDVLKRLMEKRQKQLKQ
jgi:hypothetical protein